MTIGMIILIVVAILILLGVGLLVEGILNLCMGLFAIKIIKRQQPEIAQTMEYWIDKDE